MISEDRTSSIKESCPSPKKDKLFKVFSCPYSIDCKMGRKSRNSVSCNLSA